MTRPLSALARLVVVCALLAACDSATTSSQPAASDRTTGCSVAVAFVDGGPGVSIRGEGFEADRSVVLTVTGRGEPETLIEQDFPALRTDARGVVIFGLGAERDDIGPMRVEMSADECTAGLTVDVLEAMVPPACPTGDAVASGGPASDAYEALVLADAPIAYWRFEEESGPLARATVGEDGAIQGNGVFGQAGAVPGSRALGLDGDGDWVNIVDLQLPADFTIEGWISFCEDEISLEDSLFSQDGDFGQNLTFRDGFVFLWSGDFDRGDVVWTEEPFEHSRWYHLALTRSGVDVTLHVDGLAVMSAPYEPLVSVGALGYSGFSWTAAQIDEFAIYDHALTEEQLAARVAAAS